MSKHPQADRILESLRGLESASVAERVAAREDLVGIGREATGGLLKALQHADQRVRWEAAKAFEEIADSRAAPGLVDALEDPDRDVRWVAATALIALGGDCLTSLLDALCRKPESVRLRERAHHVLRALRQDHGEVVQPVLEALEHGPTEVLPAVARTAHEQFQQRP